MPNKNCMAYRPYTGGDIALTIAGVTCKCRYYGTVKDDKCNENCGLAMSYPTTPPPKSCYGLFSDEELAHYGIKRDKE